MDERPTISQRPRHPEGERAGPAQPGLVLVFTGGAPALAALPVGEAPVLLGRGALPGSAGEDLAMSRRHAEVSLVDGVLCVRDLGSRNGTWVDGVRVHEQWPLAGAHSVRVGSTLLVPCEDVRPLWGGAVSVGEDGAIVGPRLRPVWDAVAREAPAGRLHIRGETGVGKELAARHFHRSGARAQGPFVAVNCAAVPAALAERLFFGARRGAYSDAADAEGYLQAAHGGTLFLDEIAELPLELQAKLLRVVETREVVPLGAVKPIVVDLGLCSATHGDLRELVAEGRFRADLYHRIGEPAVEVPPLRARLEELPWVAVAVARGVHPDLTLDVTFVETGLARAWPGNLRELATAVAAAARRALAAGRTELDHDDLARPPAPASQARPTLAATPVARRADPGRAAIEDALRQSGGNVAAAARLLATHRTQLRRWMQRHGLQGQGDDE